MCLPCGVEERVCSQSSFWRFCILNMQLYWIDGGFLFNRRPNQEIQFVVGTENTMALHIIQK